MLRIESQDEVATVEIKGISNHMETLAELMACCDAVFAQIAKETDVSFEELKALFLSVLKEGNAPEELQN